jgi:hypothetical protein
MGDRNRPPPDCQEERDSTNTWSNDDGNLQRLAGRHPTGGTWTATSHGDQPKGAGSSGPGHRSQNSLVPGQQESPETRKPTARRTKLVKAEEAQHKNDHTPRL